MPAPANMKFAAFDHRSANRYGGVHVAYPGEVADGTRIDSTLYRFQLVDNLHCTYFGAPLTVPAGKVARSTSIAVIPGFSNFPTTLETMCMTWE